MAIPMSGTVVSFDQKSGYGHVEPDDGDVLLLVHRRSLRNPADASALRPGQRVLFNPRAVPRGILANDVRLAIDDVDTAQELPELLIGTMGGVVADRGFAFVDLPDGRHVFCHVSNVQDSTELHPAGTIVQCSVVPTSRGYEALQVNRADRLREQQFVASTSAPGGDLLAQAVLARDAKDHSTAREIYARGMDQTPSIQLILSYAAFEKNQNRPDTAMDIYKRGISIFPRVAKLKEDAGVLAGRMGNTDEAAAFLHSALGLCRTTEQSGEVGVLLALARLHSRSEARASLTKALKYFDDAGQVGAPLRGKDALMRNVLRIRLQHHRGDLTYRFLVACGFEVISAALLPTNTTGAELIVRIHNDEIEESYGVTGNILIRCIFKAHTNRMDVDDLDRSMQKNLDTGVVNDQLALLVLSSVPERLTVNAIQEDRIARAVACRHTHSPRILGGRRR